MPSEIIQIGWCFLNPKTGERFGRSSQYVKPMHSNISQFCTDLTGITAKNVRSAQPLPVTSTRLVRNGLRQYVSAGYGDDWDYVKSECDMSNCETFLSDEYIDVSTLTKLALNSYKNIGLKKACEELGVSWEGEEHRADWDAWNTAGLLSTLLTSDWRNIP
jgi:inhibitor of KinA sporulation pathway (predicted exonuclease)